MEREQSFIYWLGNNAFTADEIQMATPIYKRVSSLLGTEIKPKILSQKLNEIPEQRIDMKKFKTIFKPNFSETNLDEGLSNTISWYKEFYE